MVAYRRGHSNFALDRAAQWATQLGKPLVVFEALRCDYQWASDRLHHFVVQGMRDNARRFADTNIRYYPYVEPSRGAGGGLLKQLAGRAAVLVSDDYPCFFLPAQHRAAARQVNCRYELVDSNGLLPLRAATKTYARAVDLRRFLQKTLPKYLGEHPAADLSGVNLPVAHVPQQILDQWPESPVETMADDTGYLADLPIDHAVGVVDDIAGGETAALEQLQQFIAHRLARYGERNDPAADAASGLSPWLHFGHIGAHQVFAAVTQATGWKPSKLADKANGSSSGWWGIDAAAEGFLDELITWRELGFNMCSRQRNYDRYESLPAWGGVKHAQNPPDYREFEYSLDEFERAATHDRLWNAAQWQLVTSGRMHNYLRMLWGKKILHWSRSPREALDIMLHLNNKYAIDGRDPNSYSGIFWVLGRYDRAWGPEREIFGKIRYMTSDSTRRKLHVDDYITRYSPRKQQQARLFD
jgi:deoxyribodipyrimidine photo-lyase